MRAVGGSTYFDSIMHNTFSKTVIKCAVLPLCCSHVDLTFA